MKTPVSCFAALVMSAASVLAEEPFPGNSLMPGERCCYAWSRATTSLAEGDATRILFELHKEALEGQNSVIWGRLYAEVMGSAKAGYTWDGCSPSETPGLLHCSYACDGGSLTLAAAANRDLALTISADGVRVRACGTSSEEMGAFAVRPEQVGGVVTLSPVDGGLCRGAMEHFEKLLDEEEMRID